MSGPGISRRQFMKSAAAGAASIALLKDRAFAEAPAQSIPRKPNVLFIHTDQQHFEAMSGLGCEYVHTPKMDRLMRRGVSFTQSYSANPVCTPARSCWYTGRTSSENGMLSNNHQLKPDMPDLGQWFRANGYESFYSGKWHVPGRNPRASFNCLTADPSGQGEHQDQWVSKSAQAFLHGYSGDKPFFLSLGFLQPHDCCYWTFANVRDPGKLPFPLRERDLPELPKNFPSKQEEPAVLRTHLQSLWNWTKDWSELHWRHYIHDYYRMVEMVDAEIGLVLDALDDSRFASNTLVVFTSDHGDGLARRKLIQKWFLYDEAVRVPMIVSPPGGSDARTDRVHVVSGLDIAPTLCDYAGIPAPPKFRGRSMKTLVDGRTSDWREFIVSEANITGRMVRTPEYKLIEYEDDPVKQLFDMRHDPWELNNLAHEAKYADTVADLKKRLGEWESRTELA